MIFNDEPRFSKKLVAHPADGAICGVTKSATEEHVGPGSYLAEQFEERRSGWRRKSFSNRQPMEEPKNKSISRSDYYVSGVLSPNGTMATPASPARSHSPGPGYYEGPHSVFSFPTDAHRKQDLNLTSFSGASIQNLSTRPTTMASTPRFAFSNSACINKGVLFQSATNDQNTVGPGYYSVPRNDFLKRSYNVRANRTRSASNTPVTTPISSPIKPTAQVRQVRQVSTPRGSYRPSSAGGSPNPAGMANTTSQLGTPRGRMASSVPASTSRPRSSSAGATSRPSSTTGTPRSPAQLANSSGPGTPTRAAVALSGRGKGLFSEHGSTEKPSRPQQQLQQVPQHSSSGNGARM